MTEIETIKVKKKETKYFNKRLNNKLRDTDVYTFLSHMHIHIPYRGCKFLFVPELKKRKRFLYSQIHTISHT